MKRLIKILTDYISFHIQIIRELFSIDKKSFMLVMILNVITPISAYIELYFSKYIIDAFVYQDIKDKDVLAKILISVCVVCLLIIVSKLLSLLDSLINNRYSKKIITEKKEFFIRNLDKKHFENYEDPKYYQELYVAWKAPEKYATALSHIAMLLNIIVFFFIYMAVLCENKWYYGILLLIVLVEYLIINKNTANRWEAYYEKNVIPEQRRCNYFEGILGNRINHSNIQINRQLSFFAKNYEDYAERERKSTLKMNALAFWTELKLSLGYVLVTFIILADVARNIIYANASIGEFAMISNALFQLFMLYKSFTQYIYSEKEYIKVIKSFRFILENDSKKEHEAHITNECIDIKNVRYKYKQAENYSLDGIDISFQKGEKVALVGVNGSGKTTLIMNILDLLFPTEGSIINNIGKAVAIMQDFQSYQLTIKENVELGVGGKELPEEKINAILEKVDLKEFVAGLPEGMYTHLGQLNDGIELSKGQLQRLALARLLANEDAKVWILDEPTAYLDPISEIDLYNEILKLSGDRTVFFISHRLGFAKMADRIIVMDNGRIIEDGTHSNLILNDNSLYKRMYEAQLSWYKE